MKTILFGQPARLLPAFLLLFCWLQNVEAAIFSKQSGPWNSASTWEGGAVPANWDDVIVKAGHTITRNNAFLAQGTLYVYGTLVYSGNVSREFAAGHDIEIQGLLRMEGGSLFADGIVYGNGTFRQTAGNTTFGRAYVVETTDVQGGSVFFQNINNGNLYLDHFSLKNATVTANAQTDLVVKVSMNWQHNGKFAGRLRIDEGATLTFASGNNTFRHDLELFNYGTIISGAGSLTQLGGGGVIYNHGLWEFNVPANSGSYVFDHYVYNFGTILKKGAGGASFEASGFLGTESGSLVHVQQGGITVHTSNAIPQQGLYQVDAGAGMLVFAYTIGEYVPFAANKFINNGTVHGYVKFAGPGFMILEGNGKFGKMEIAKTGGEVTLAGSPEVTELLTLSSGLMRLNNFDLRLGTATVGQASFDSYLETNGTGSCVRTCEIGSIKTFPVGNNGFAPLSVALQSGGGDIKVRVTDQFFGEYNGAGAPLCDEQVPVGVVRRNWFVGEQAPGSATAILYAGWSVADEQAGFDRANCTLGRYASNNWEPNGFGAALDNSGTFLRVGAQATALGLFGVFDENHLTDVNFSAPAPTASSPVCQWNDLQLFANTSPNAACSWTGPNGFQSNEHDPVIPAAQLFNGGSYTVYAEQYGCPPKQASVNVLVNATPTATINGPGTIQPGETAELIAYGGTFYLWSTGDTTPSIVVAPAQTAEYSVTVTNVAGCSETASLIVTVGGATAVKEADGVFGKMTLAPNPATVSSLLTFDSAVAGEAQLTLTDQIGPLAQRTVQVVRGANALEIPLIHLPAGVYHVVLQMNDEVKTMRVVKMSE